MSIFKNIIMKDIKVITVDNLHQTLATFIDDGKHIIGEYEDMKEVILLMIKAGYMFGMDRDRLRDAMEDITYMLCPDDDANKDRVSRGLEYEDDSESDYGEDDIVDQGGVEDIGDTSEM
jgi:hypothetical protein